MQSAETVLGVLRESHWRAGYPETGPSGSEGGRAEKDQRSWHLAARPTLRRP
jgi:hypothetical protein